MINRRYRNKNVSWIDRRPFFCWNLVLEKFIDPKDFFYYKPFLWIERNFHSALPNNGIPWNRVWVLDDLNKKWPQSLTNLWIKKKSALNEAVESNFAIDHEKWPFSEYKKKEIRSFQVWEKFRRSDRRSGRNIVMLTRCLSLQRWECPENKWIYLSVTVY